ncbi:hypothetical protein [Phyllobacterium zundukense]|uniref:50S ribosomal protein L29 n=1 Tax=Phyllobacterium zundukense TaxID=1867719 RepID=A0A2N9VQU5_9HYPH|nr:hypothetical protein [Phyllobacterium zundukense]ATU92298.1 hypothetical protein BLM14_12115 [Phyllobacterium zundukense]PIO41863.1 hypothetical protein B5P45_22555 [Phyllobacterium zundukense]
MTKKPTDEELRAKLSQLEEDLGIYEDRGVFSIGTMDNEDPIDPQTISAIKQKIAELRAKLSRDE